MVSFVIAHFFVWQNPNTGNRENEQKPNNVNHRHVSTVYNFSKYNRRIAASKHLVIKHVLDLA